MPSLKSAIYVSGPIDNPSIPGESTIQFEFMNTVSKVNVLLNPLELFSIERVPKRMGEGVR